MPLSIRNPRAEQLAREVAAESGESMTQVVIHALEEQLQTLETETRTRTMALVNRLDEGGDEPGEKPAQEELLVLVYDELHQLARRYLSRERPEHTLLRRGELPV